ncbi:MAG: glycosyltransferase [Daejeonella sp.]|nr:glycosyltransferase [Daejeonella sp.]
MKVLHINTYPANGGAGRACSRLNLALKKQGIDSEIAVNFTFSENKEVYNFSDGFLNHWFTAAGIVLEGLIAKLLLKPLKIPFSFPLWGKNISQKKVVKQADIIHLHWINHAFLRPQDLQKLKNTGKPIVWTFHDSNAFTGGCHVRYTCDHFENECGNCPVLKNSNPNDWSHKIWLSKQKAYSDLNFEIIAPSNWMAQSIGRSKLLGDRNVHVIPNTLDTAKFKPHDKIEARKKLGVSIDKFIIMSGFMPSRKDLHKGTPYLIEALNILVNKHGINPCHAELIVFGNRDANNVPEFSIPATFLGTISDDKKLALCYSAADVFVTPSLEDNLPNTVMESLSCGTPIVAFTTGGIPDMVEHRQNGYLAQYKSSEDLANGIKWVIEHPDRLALNTESRKSVLDNFSEHIIAERHMLIYRELLQNSNSDI